MTFSQVQYLLEIHRAGSVTQAAKNLFVSQSSVSIALNALEKELGFPIFVRSKKGLVPTPQGADTISHAKRLWESYRLMTSPTQSPHTNVRIACATVPPAQNAFARLVRENHGRNDLSFSFDSCSPETTVSKLQFFDRELVVNLILVPNYLEWETTFQKHGLDVRYLASLPAAILIGKDHPLFHAEHISPADLTDSFFLDYPSKVTSRGLLKAGVMQISDDRILTSTHSAVRNQLIQDGLAVSVSCMFPEDLTRDSGIRYIPLEGLYYKLCAVSNPLQSPVPEVERFIQLLTEELDAAGVSNT